MTLATPVMTELSASLSVGSAMRVSSACESVGEVSASETIGCWLGSKRLRIGSFISSGRSARSCGDLVADVLLRLLHVGAELELHDHQGVAVVRRRLDLVDPAEAGERLLQRVDDLALHRRPGAAPG